jgi:hypothetical protein
MPIPVLIFPELLVCRRFVSGLSAGEMIETIGVNLVNLTGCAIWGIVGIVTFASVLMAVLAA